MAYRLTCPRCRKKGFVRAERIIAKGEASTHYFCGSCTRQWTEREPPSPRNLPARRKTGE
jgi:transposase-like protein